MDSSITRLTWLVARSAGFLEALPWSHSTPGMAMAAGEGRNRINWRRCAPAMGATRFPSQSPRGTNLTMLAPRPGGNVCRSSRDPRQGGPSTLVACSRAVAKNHPKATLDQFGIAGASPP
jgi:hypothetical protein